MTQITESTIDMTINNVGKKDRVSGLSMNYLNVPDEDLNEYRTRFARRGYYLVQDYRIDGIPGNGKQLSGWYCHLRKIVDDNVGF